MMKDIQNTKLHHLLWRLNKKTLSKCKQKTGWTKFNKIVFIRELIYTLWTMVNYGSYVIWKYLSNCFFWFYFCVLIYLMEGCVSSLNFIWNLTCKMIRQLGSNEVIMHRQMRRFDNIFFFIKTSHVDSQ